METKSQCSFSLDHPSLLTLHWAHYRAFSVGKEKSLISLKDVEGIGEIGVGKKLAQQDRRKDYREEQGDL